MRDIFKRVVLHEIQEDGAGDEDAGDGEDKNKEGHQHLHGGLWDHMRAAGASVVSLF